MTITKLNKDEKTAELQKYRDLLIATLDWYLSETHRHIQTAEFDSVKHYESLKVQTEEHFQKRRLTILRNWFRDMTEMPLETADFKFNKYLQDKTGYDVDIFKAYFQRVDKIIAKGSISTDNQYYDINQMVDHLCQTEPVDEIKINTLNKLLLAYERKKTRT